MQKTKSIALILGVLTMSFLVGYLILAAWTEPTTSPPGGNVPPPLNTSLNAQSKEGALVIGANPSVGTTSLIVLNGNVGIGTTTTPAAKLDVNGNVYFEGGSGDLNNDGFLNILDGSLFTNYFDGDVIFTKERLAAADMNGDGQVTLDDWDMFKILFDKEVANITYQERYDAKRQTNVRGLAYDQCKGICVASNTISCDSGWTMIYSHSGTGCEGAYNYGVLPRLGGQWSFTADAATACYQTGYEKVYLGGVEQASVPCNLCCDGCYGGGGAAYDSSCAICCQ